MQVKTSNIRFATLKMSQALLVPLWGGLNDWAGGKVPQLFINVEVLLNRKMGK